jgi:hypothetical protein
VSWSTQPIRLSGPRGVRRRAAEHSESTPRSPGRHSGHQDRPPARVAPLPTGPARADDCTLEATDDLLFGLSLGGAPLNIGAGGRVPAQPVDHDEIDRGVGLAVSAAVAQSRASAASLLMRCGLSPAVIRSCAVAWVPTPEMALVAGAVSAIRSAVCSSVSAISLSSICTRWASRRSTIFAAAKGSPILVTSTRSRCPPPQL